MALPVYRSTFQHEKHSTIVKLKIFLNEHEGNSKRRCRSDRPKLHEEKCLKTNETDIFQNTRTTLVE